MTRTRSSELPEPTSAGPRRLRLLAGAVASAALAAGALGSPGPLAAQSSRDDGAGHAPVETRVVVRVLANDAKLVGSGVGGARVTIQDLDSGEVLASGLHEGSTGDTRLIVEEPVRRGATVFDTEGAAAFRATLALTGPTRVEVEAEGPLGTPHAAQRASRTLLLIPGEDVTGEGVVLALNGFTVEILGAGAPSSSTRTVRARVTMLCGCPTTPGGLWDADRIDVRAQLVRDGRILAEAPLAYAGEASTYEGSLALEGVPDPGSATLRVLASDPTRANFGMAVAGR